MTTESTSAGDSEGRRRPDPTEEEVEAADDTSARDEDNPGRNEGAPGAEMGISQEATSTFEPEEDPEGHD